MPKIIKLTLLCICGLLFFLSCKPFDAIVIGTPIIKAGTAKITGRITSKNDVNKDSIYVNIFVPHPITGEVVQYKALADRSGKFSIDVDVETNISLIGLYTSLKPYKSLLIKLTSGGVTNVDVAYDSNFGFEKINITPTGMTQNDMKRGLEVIGEMIELKPNKAPEPLYNKNPNEFLDQAKASVLRRLELLNKDSLISKEFKGILSKDFRIWIYNVHAFDYEAAMRLNYRNVSQDRFNEPVIKKVDRSYYRFLKDFNLNDPQYLICSSFWEFQKTILQNEIIGLPEIGESDIPSWLAKVKVVLSDLVGFKDGQYYDVLAANAYGRQLNEEVKPLSEKQKTNIAAYWKKGEIAKILLRKNQQVVELDKFKSPVVVNDISSVPDDKVMETIVAKHKGKVVFIDLWATWCGPCLDAMKQFGSAKGEFHDKAVAFVYLTNASSPRKLWEEKIKGIGSEHYYLKDTQWEYIMNHFGLEYIPSYLLYNKEGVFINKVSAFPGNEKVKAMINGLL
ncbi:TlpA disulfide reductase family protein [Pedobacter foliorum]|uniref:TlpA family protein disulfide reductase n=1 Tax=Pedobacter foliorum TaxID=2739058 RepID=UPI00156550DC|nr:TlpA disulfide reductase family protein [Pedobacter foliorum]NRF38030.1 TlpA family protein disulfide reductase [Pedobacter foliorum]